MKILHLSLIACIAVIGIITFAIIIPSQPKRIAGLEDDSGMVTLGNHAYYFTTVNDTMTTYHGEGVQESFHGIVFTFFPRPFSGGPLGSCGNMNFGSDLKFTDNTHELLSVGIPGMPCGENYIQTVLSNHTNPQAGLTVYDQKIKLLVEMQSESVPQQGSSQITHYYGSYSLKPKVELYDYYYDKIDKDNAIVSINHNSYYQTTLNYTDYDLKKGTSLQFQNVTFVFPEGVMTTPGGAFIMLDIKFQDDSEEIYGENKKNPDGSGVLGGIGIPTPYGPHLATNSTTVLGTHMMPQAGMTIYNDKIKLLVSTQNQTLRQPSEFSKLAADPFPDGIPHRLVFFMKSNSTGKIFLRYISDQPENGTLPLGGQVYTGNPNNFNPLNSSKLSISVSPDSIPLKDGNVTAVYTIKAQNIPSGIYWVFLTQICGVMPVAIDMDSLQVSPSDIPVYSQHCPAQITTVQILGVSGLTADYKPAQPFQ